jgi:hypothetical protein
MWLFGGTWRHGSACCLLHAGFLLGLFFHSGGGGDMFLGNSGTYLSNYTASPNKLLQAVIILTCIPKVPVSIHGLGQMLSCLIFIFMFSSVFPGKCQDNTMAYRPVAKRWLCKQWQFLGNGYVNTFPLLGSRLLTMQNLDYNNGNGAFLRGPCRDVISNGQGQTQLSSVREAVKRGTDSVKLKNLHC